MRVEDIVALDNLSILSAELLDLLQAFGFTEVRVQRDKSATYHFCVIEAFRGPNGSSEVWSGTGATAEEAQEEARDAMTHWILNQPIPFTIPSP